MCMSRSERVFAQPPAVNIRYRISAVELCRMCRATPAGQVTCGQMCTVNVTGDSHNQHISKAQDSASTTGHILPRPRGVPSIHHTRASSLVLGPRTPGRMAASARALTSLGSQPTPDWSAALLLLLLLPLLLRAVLDGHVHLNLGVRIVPFNRKVLKGASLDRIDGRVDLEGREGAACA